MDGGLYIIAKAPRIGLAKTRLGRVIGHEAAVTLYSAFLRDLAARFVEAPFECGWYLTPSDAWDDVSPLVDQGERKGRVLFQREGDLTDRQRELFRRASERGEERVVLIASDSPQVTVEVIEQAFRELDHHDIVFGPTYDGGYYLIGMRGHYTYDVLHELPMSTDSVLDGVVARAREAGLSVGWVETTFDVDEVEDLEHLRRLVEHRADLSATRAALEKLGFHGDGRRPGIEATENRSPAANSRSEADPTAGAVEPREPCETATPGSGVGRLESCGEEPA